MCYFSKKYSFLLVCFGFAFTALKSMDKLSSPSTLRVHALVAVASLYDHQKWEKSPIPLELLSALKETRTDLYKKAEHFQKQITQHQELSHFQLIKFYELPPCVHTAITSLLVPVIQNKPYENHIKRQLRLLPHAPYSTEAQELAKLVELVIYKEKLRTTLQVEEQSEAVKLLYRVTQELRNKYASTPNDLSSREINKNLLLAETALYLSKDQPYRQYRLEETLLCNAASEGNLEALEFFFNRGISPNAHKSTPHQTLLDMVAVCPTIETLKFVLAKGANPNLSFTKRFETPALHFFLSQALHYPLCRNTMKARLELLLQYGAHETINYEDTRGNTTLDIARRKGFSSDIIDLLIQYGAMPGNPKPPDNHGYPIDCAYEPELL